MTFVVTVRNLQHQFIVASLVAIKSFTLFVDSKIIVLLNLLIILNLIVMNMC